jgi:hypothetical protein
MFVPVADRAMPAAMTEKADDDTPRTNKAMAATVDEELKVRLGRELRLTAQGTGP